MTRFLTELCLKFSYVIQILNDIKRKCHEYELVMTTKEDFDFVQYVGFNIIFHSKVFDEEP